MVEISKSFSPELLTQSFTLLAAAEYTTGDGWPYEGERISKDVR